MICEKLPICIDILYHFVLLQLLKYLQCFTVELRFVLWDVYFY